MATFEMLHAMGEDDSIVEMIDPATDEPYEVSTRDAFDDLLLRVWSWFVYEADFNLPVIFRHGWLLRTDKWGTDGLDMSQFAGEYIPAMPGAKLQ